MTNQVCIAETSYAYPKHSMSLEQLRGADLISSSVEDLSAFGFEYAKVADGESGYELAYTAASELLEKSDIDPEEIDFLLYASALPSNVDVSEKNAIGLFNYPASKLQYELGLGKSHVIGVSQAGCVSLASAMRIGASLLRSEGDANAVLCVSADVLPEDSSREILHNVISDAGCAALLNKGEKGATILSQHQVTKGYFFKPEDTMNEVLTSYFPTAKHVIETSLEKVSLAPKDIDLVIPHNVNKKSWEILSSLIDVPLERIYLDHMGKNGHSVAADNVVNLSKALEEGRLSKGDRALLFTFGFGSHWSSSVVEI